MSTTHRSPTPPSTKRLLHELQQYSQEPNDALLHVGPVSEEQILHWEAVMKGVKGSGYEGMVSSYLQKQCSARVVRPQQGWRNNHRRWR